MFRVSPALHLFHYFGLLNNHTPRGGNSLSRGSSWESIWFEPGTPRHFSPQRLLNLRLMWHCTSVEKSKISWRGHDYYRLLNMIFGDRSSVLLEPSETLWPPLCDIALGKMLQSNKICSYMWFLKGALVAYRPRWVEQGQQKPLMALSSQHRRLSQVLNHCYICTGNLGIFGLQLLRKVRRVR